MTSDDEIKVESQRETEDFADLEWFNTFLKHLKNYYLEQSGASLETTPKPNHELVLRAFLATLCDGANWTADKLATAIGIAQVESVFRVQDWNEQLATRRFNLIDKQFQGLASPAENLELIGLDALLRRQSEMADSQAFERTINLLEKSSGDVEEKA